MSASAAALPARPAGTGTQLRGAGRCACLRCRAQLRRLRARSAGAGRPGRGCPESHEVCCGSGEGCGASGAARGGRDGGPFRDLVVRIWRRGRRLASLWPSWTCLLLAHLGVHFGTPSAWSPGRQPEFAARRPRSPLAQWRPLPRPTVSTNVLGCLPCPASCSGPAAVAQSASFSFLKASLKLVLMVQVARACYLDENPHVLLSMMMASADVSTLLEGAVGAFLLPCFCSCCFPA